MVGGMSMLSGYVQKVREEEKDPVLYVISGDMLQGSIIDQEYKGISTILIMNMLAPDVVTLGNHETDYGFAHLMFLERCARFPIVNANLYIKPTKTNLFRSHYIMNADGIRLLFIGIITELVMDRKEPLIGTFISVEDAANEIEYICNCYRDVDIDLTVLLTHIGFEDDKKLASLLPKEIGVDLIIGGHSHTMLEEPEKVNDILITQVGTGSDFIGRYDLIINMDTNSVHDFIWHAIPIDDSHCPVDPVMDELLNDYQSEIDGKYNTVLCRFPHALEHKTRFRETELGSVFADIFKYQLGVDIAFVASGSIRTQKLGPLVTLTDLMETFPYNEPMISFSVTGKMLENMLTHLMHTLFHEDGHEFYQWSAELRVDVLEDGSIANISYLGAPLEPEKTYRISMQQYHYGCIANTFGVAHDEIEETGRVRIVSTSSQDNIVEYFRTHTILKPFRCDGRILLRKPLVVETE
jgi:5'-nucleotidase